MKEELYYTLSENTIFIRAVGHITAQLCLDLRDNVNEMIYSNKSIDHLYIDLSECKYMDSTFMGLIVGLNNRFLKKFHEKLIILNPSESAFQLLKGLGVLPLLKINKEDIKFPDTMEKLIKNRRLTSDFILKAHDNLAQLSASNEKKFALIRNLLAKEQDKSKH